MSNTIASTVKALRRQYGLTQEDASRKAGVSLAFLRELEQGKTTARMDTVNQVLSLFNYSLVAEPNNETSESI